MKRILTLLLLLLVLPGAAYAQQVEGGPRVTDSEGFKVSALFDGNATRGPTAQDGAYLTLEEPEGLQYLYLIFDTEYPCFTVTGENGEKKTVGQEQFLHNLVDVSALFGAPQTKVTLSFEEGPVPLLELFLFTPGELPDWVQQWEGPAEGETDLILFSTHCDDEQLFFAGVLPYYAGELGYKVEVVYLTNHRNVTEDGYLRCHEALDGLWACGVRQYPVFGTFYDYYCKREEDAVSQYKNLQGVTMDDLLSFVVAQLRRFKPLVALGHDLNGEYGHGAHKLYADLLTQSWEAAASDWAYPESLNKYGAWRTPKVYLHLYEENPITMDWDQPLSAFGGMTAYEVCRERGFPSHKSQVSGFEWFMAGHDRASDIPKYSPCQYGLFASTTGPDTVGGDFFENLKSYAQQAEEATQAEEAARLEEERQAMQAAQTDPPETSATTAPTQPPKEDPASQFPFVLFLVPPALVIATIFLLRKKP